MSTNTPPPVPSSNPPPISPPPTKSSNKTLWIVLACVGAAALFGVAILAAILIPTVGKVRETARRVADASNVRQIVQGALIYGADHDNKLPPVNLTATGEAPASTPASIQAVAAALARDGGLGDASVWFAISERSQRGGGASILNGSRTALDDDFKSETVFGWDFVTGLDLSLPSTTPVAWTRGLRPDGTWDPNQSVYGSSGGYVAFLGGNVQFFPDLRAALLIRPDGTTTSNILETLPATTRVVGAGPGTLNGATGLAKP